MSADESRHFAEDSPDSRPLVVLTGSSRGIGRAAAIALGAAGARLALLGRQSSAQRDTLDRLGASQIDYRFYEVDLVDPNQIQAAAHRLLELQGTPCAVVSNAGVIERCEVQTTSCAAWDRQQAVNLRAPFLLDQALLPSMLRARRGRFVHVASIAATVGTARAAAYCASKGGLVGFTKSLAAELTDTGLSAVAILPGSVDTEMLVGSGFVPRMTVDEVAQTITHFALIAPLAHNGACIEMFGI
ncbi:MAG TPA: SDR family oxidoreductase [Polyangiaceae bacterium]|nr:SDR family oxidoreductase [Polyangiaceae bacterium]